MLNQTVSQNSPALFGLSQHTESSCKSSASDYLECRALHTAQGKASNPSGASARPSESFHPQNSSPRPFQFDGVGH
jgi:hypothetical protein